ncbi:hypothetical protein Rhal01_02015 [Rubritalea halochordaticola]|uniref:Uncharacterized protein n=1 Tax=Rubritalea halochordaticola TaxID=714537 RepID=A0ABP9UZG6_9BACT
MTTILRTMLCMAAALACTLPAATFAQQKTVNKGKLVRIIRNPDGSFTRFSRDPSNTVLEKVTYLQKRNGEQVIRNRTMYRRNKFGKLYSGHIFDGQRTMLFRIVYGYDKATGRLVAENMFDARVKRTYPDNPSKEMPVRALRYTYNSHGEQSPPIIFSSMEGKDAQELQQWLREQRMQDGTLPSADPFRNDPVNPNAKRLGE